MFRQIKRFVKTVVFLLALLLLVPALSSAALKLPDLDRGPALYDFAQMVDSARRSQIDSLIQDIEKSTTAEIAVVTIESLEDESLEDYASRLFEKTGIGKEEKDNGVLILVAEKERKIRIENGYGVEAVLTDGETGRIIREIIAPRFKEEDYGQGIYDGVQAIGHALSGEGGEKSTAGSQSGPLAGLMKQALIFLVGLGVAAVLTLVIWLTVRSRKCPRCGGWLKVKKTVLKHSTYTSEGRQRVVRDCGKCGYHDERIKIIPIRTRPSAGGSSSGGGSSGSSGSSFGGGRSGGGGASGGW